MIKDSPFIVEKNDLIEINYGKRFPLKKSYLLFVFLFIVIFSSFLLPFSTLSISFQLISLLLMLFMFTANTGIIIEKKQKVKFFMSALGFQIGTWKKFSNFSCLVFKTSAKKRENVIVNMIGDSTSVVEKFKSTELYIMDSSHRKKIMCGSFDSYNEAKDFAKEVSEVLNYPIQKFSPRRFNNKLKR